MRGFHDLGGAVGSLGITRDGKPALCGHPSWGWEVRPPLSRRTAGTCLSVPPREASRRCSTSKAARPNANSSLATSATGRRCTRRSAPMSRPAGYGALHQRRRAPLRCLGFVDGAVAAFARRHAQESAARRDAATGLNDRTDDAFRRRATPLVLSAMTDVPTITGAGHNGTQSLPAALRSCGSRRSFAGPPRRQNPCPPAANAWERVP